MKIVEKENIIFNEKELIKEKVLKNMIRKTNFSQEKQELIFLDIMKREKIENTVIGFNFAIPHTKVDYIDKAYVIFTKLENEISWAEDEENVKNVIMLIIPKNNVNLHIDILKDISSKLIDESFRKDLECAKNIDEIEKVLNR